MIHVDCNGKVEQLRRTMNAARMIHEMSTHRSMYTPLSIPPTQLPQYVHLDRKSQWHTSALLSAALESVTLPTRLRHGIQNRWSTNDLEAALNVNGNQRIAQLQCSMFSPEDAPLLTAIPHGSIDNRAPSGDNRILVEQDGLKLAESRFDMDLSCGNTRLTRRTATQHDVSGHVFGAIETMRTRFKTAKRKGTDEDETTDAGEWRRAARLPVVKRFVSPALSGIMRFRRILPYAIHPVQVPLLA